MKKSLLTMAAALVLTVVATGAAEARDGFYIGLRGGNTNFNLNNKEDTTSAKAREDFGDVWNISGALGYKYKYFRIEGEYIYRDDVDDEYKYSSGGHTSTHKVTLESDSIMANAYIDFMPNFWISPYITGGIGLTRLDLRNIESGGFTESKSADNFTWMLGGGLSLRLNKCVNLDAGYRYMDMGDIDDANINVHEIYGGLRFTF